MENHTLEVTRLLFTLELIGVLAAAATGALKGIRCGMDIFGVLVLAVITALGGGLIRDILVDRFPVSLANPIYFDAALFGGAVTMLAVRRIHGYLLWINILDALGLASFSILGAQLGLARHLNFLAILLLGLLTGIGGGLLRDILANDVPYVLRREIYALASIAGITLFWAIAQIPFANDAALLAGVLAIFGIRLAAIHWNLNAPRIHFRDE